jgi:hypothetical protein
MSGACQRLLTELIGSPPAALRWDICHRLKGDVCVHGCELVVIAPRDAAHRPVVLTALDWDEIRSASAEERSTLLGRYSIANHDQLVAMLARNDPVRDRRVILGLTTTAWRVARGSQCRRGC